jgi:hypothetical protein
MAATLLAGAAQVEGAPREAELCVLLQPCRPPAAFSRGPFVAEPDIRVVDLKSLRKICTRGLHLGRDERAFGCAAFQRGRCVVHLPREIQTLSPALFRIIKEHELAHCRGWVHN